MRSSTRHASASASGRAAPTRSCAAATRCVPYAPDRIVPDRDLVKRDANYSKNQEK